MCMCVCVFVVIHEEANRPVYIMLARRAPLNSQSELNTDIDVTRYTPKT